MGCAPTSPAFPPGLLPNLEGLFLGLFGTGEEKADPPIFSLRAVFVKFMAAGDR